MDLYCLYLHKSAVFNEPTEAAPVGATRLHTVNFWEIAAFNVKLRLFTGLTGENTANI